MKSFKLKIKIRKIKGSLLIPIIIFSAIALVMIGGIMNWAQTTIRVNRDLFVRESAIQLAESGIDYYRWHLAHAPTDYQDGTGAPGPYVHEVYDKDGNLAGTFSLDITPPLIGSTRVRIESTGRPASSTISRKIRVEMAIPSLAKYAVAANDVMRFGAGTEVFGPIHSNNGIRFDGFAHNLITSALSTYDDPDHTGANEFAVHTHVNPPPGSGVNSAFRPNEAPPTNPVPNRTDVFEVGRQFPVPAVDFTGLTNNLASIKTSAQASGRYFAASGNQGYRITLNTNDTFNIRRVTSLSNDNDCNDPGNQPGCGEWSIQNTTNVGTYPIPANGLIFVEDNVWVAGSIDGARVTIAAGRFPDNPSTRPQLTVNNDITYTNYDGTDVIALISQGNLNVGLVSDTDLRIDAALVSQNGRVGRYSYAASCAPHNTKNSLTLYGMIATNIRYGFAYTGNSYCGGTSGGGYCTRNINYDANLLYGPPPSFPLTSDQYEILSWEEVI